MGCATPASRRRRAGRTDGWMDGWTDGWTHTHAHAPRGRHVRSRGSTAGNNPVPSRRHPSRESLIEMDGRVRYRAGPGSADNDTPLSPPPKTKHITSRSARATRKILLLTYTTTRAQKKPPGVSPHARRLQRAGERRRNAQEGGGRGPLLARRSTRCRAVAEKRRKQKRKQDKTKHEPCPSVEEKEKKLKRQGQTRKQSAIVQKKIHLTPGYLLRASLACLPPRVRASVRPLPIPGRRKQKEKGKGKKKPKLISEAYRPTPSPARAPPNISAAASSPLLPRPRVVRSGRFTVRRRGALKGQPPG